MGSFITSVIIGLIIGMLWNNFKPCPVGVAIRLKDAGWLAQADGKWSLGGVEKRWQSALKELDGEPEEPEEELESASKF